ncbi:efflux RND transporter periplasmic adaptor subunit [Aureimonas altamirensis]|uniref:efflux RND transporter periplasmic adaptor subunit n=1 Tax=Aureimonas altamirensis TaxID=370622 RepID=UPI00203742F1|nr:efflux RND transporter periplasmic adaptor subunit [Aureimonas altamirensis]MCM2505046.1 efflux RND transporter periplasmic adaptor subunit [Aureimonas altamirensis]
MQHAAAKALSAIVFMFGLQPASAQDGRPAAPVEVAVVEERSVDNAEAFIGRVEAIESVDIQARVQGFIEDVTFDGGEAVAAGDLLFRIEPAQYEAALAAARAQRSRAQAERQNAEQTFARTRELVQRNTLAQANLDEAEAALAAASANVEAASAQVQQAELDLSYTSISSPIDGRIGIPLITRGNLVGSGSGTLARVVQTDPVYVAFSLPEGVMVSLRQQYGQALDTIDPADIALGLRLPNGTDYGGNGRISFVSNEVDPQTGTLTLRATFENADRILLPGQFVTLHIGAADPEVRVFVPQTAVLRDREGAYVYVVDEGDTARQRRIETRERSDGGWFLDGGLAPGERVVVQGVQRLSDGAAVTVAGAAPEGAAAQ